MKKAFYLVGTLYFGICFIGETYGFVNHLRHKIEDKKHEAKKQERGKVRQPIGFACGGIES